MLVCVTRLIFEEPRVIRETHTTAVRMVESTLIKDNTTMKAYNDLLFFVESLVKPLKFRQYFF